MARARAQTFTNIFFRYSCTHFHLAKNYLILKHYLRDKLVPWIDSAQVPPSLERGNLVGTTYNNRALSGSREWSTQSNYVVRPISAYWCMWPLPKCVNTLTPWIIVVPQSKTVARLSWSWWWQTRDKWCLSIYQERSLLLNRQPVRRIYYKQTRQCRFSVNRP